MKRILVTGGAGFIGSHLVKALLDDGHMVIALDNLMTGSLENIKVLMGAYNNFAFMQQDVCGSIGSYNVDEIYHLACPASPVQYQGNALHTIETAFLGTRSALQLARDCGARILLASTSEIYGEPEVHPQPETYYGNVCTTSPRACYDEGKRAAETLATIYAKDFDVEVRIARIFNTYGPHMALDDGRVVSEFIYRGLTGKPLVIHGNGKQSRSFCYVEDMVQGLMKLMQSNLQGPVNLGNPEETSIEALAWLILKMTKSESRLIDSVPLPNDPKKRKPDITLAESVLKWSPRTSLIVGLQYTIEDIQQRSNSRIRHIPR